MPSYARFIKEILTKKRKVSKDGTVELEAGCSVIGAVSGQINTIKRSTRK
uniref:Uncharacterized protein n=1 Tax=Cajanus cajan TaxID=3821 RepID=A0A151UFU3_CAJCA